MHVMSNDAAGQWCLLAVDTDRVQAYVYESARLPEVRGASALLEWLGQFVETVLTDPNTSMASGLPEDLDPRKGVTLLPGASVPPDVQGRLHEPLKRLRAILTAPSFAGIEVIYSAGGSLLARVPTPQAHSIGAALEDIYGAVTLAATATHAVVPYDGEQFKSAFRRLGRELRRAKDRKPSIPTCLPGAGSDRCQSCDTRTSIGKYRRTFADETQERHICAACRVKNHATKLTDCLPWLQAAADEANAGKGEKLAQDLTEIATRGEQTGEVDGKAYVAALYMDGDNMGRTVERKAESPQRLREFSHHLKAAMESSVYGALVETIGPTKKGMWPFQVVYVGGDDLFVLVPAAEALRLARAIALGFAAQMEGEKLSMSAGIVIAHPHHPVYFLHRLAKALCSSAKRKGPGSVDFEVLRSGSVPATDTARLRGLLRRAEETAERVERRSLTMRPYTWGGLDKLLELCEAFKAAGEGGYPKGQLAALADKCLESRLVGSSHYVYQMGRTEPQRGGDALKALADKFGAISPPPWHATRIGGDEGLPVWEYTAALGDVLDLYDILV